MRVKYLLWFITFKLAKKSSSLLSGDVSTASIGRYFLHFGHLLVDLCLSRNIEYNI